jgi:hypothetical protein
MSSPPTMTAVLRPMSAPRAFRCSEICTQSSRVGDNIIAKKGKGLSKPRGTIQEAFAGWE